MKQFWTTILNWLFPLICAGCGREDDAVCLACLEMMEVRKAQECPYCRSSSSWGVSCADCNDRGTVDGLICLWNYQKGGVLARLLHYYKYEGMLEYGKKLKELFAVEGGGRLLGMDFDVMTWVPMSGKKLAKRGFNQSEQLAKSLTGECVALLEKIRETEAQMSLKRRERLKNLNKVFAVRPEWQNQLKGKVVLIVDDIATTLATLEEAAKVLKLAGAAKVFALVAARQKD